MKSAARSTRVRSITVVVLAAFFSIVAAKVSFAACDDAQQILSRNGHFLYEYSIAFRAVCQIGRGNEDAGSWVAGHAINKSMTIDCASSSVVPAISA